MANQAGIGRMAQMQAHGRAHLSAQLFPHVGGAVLGEDRGQGRAQHLDLAQREQRGQDQIPVALELPQLCFGKLHGDPPPP